VLAEFKAGKLEREGATMRCALAHACPRCTLHVFALAAGAC
jgi:hypothetical protein